MKTMILVSLLALSTMASAMEKAPGLGEAGSNSRCSTPIVTCDNCEKQRLQECGINMTAERNPNPERSFANQKTQGKRRAKTTAQ